MQAEISKLGRFPKNKELPIPVVTAIRRYHGGFAAVQRRYGETPLERKPLGYWKKWEHIEEKFLSLISECGRFPKGSEIPSDLSSAIESYHGGLGVVRKKMGYADSAHKKPDGHWRKWENVEAAVEKLIEQHGCFPLQRQFPTALAGAIHKHHGGITVVREKMGYDLLRKPPGYWQKWEHVEAWMQAEIARLGRFPKRSELPGYLASALRHHGGLGAVKIRMGHGDELAALEELVEVLADG